MLNPKDNSNNPKPKNKDDGWLKSLLQSLKRLEVIGILIAAMALSMDFIWNITFERSAIQRDRLSQAAEREEAAIAREMQAWEHLSRKNLGLNGYDTAIQYLLDRRGEIIGLDMSCEAFTGIKLDRLSEPREGFPCNHGFQFKGWVIKGRLDIIASNSNSKEPLDPKAPSNGFVSFEANQALFAGSSFENVFFFNSSFYGARLMASKIERSRLTATDFTYASFQNFSFKGSEVGDETFRANKGGDTIFQNARFFKTDMTDFKCLNCNFKDAVFFGVNLTGADLSRANDLNVEQINESVWAWDDNPPKLPEGFNDIILCDSRLKQFSSEPYYMIDVQDDETNRDPLITKHRPSGCNRWQWEDWGVKNPPDGHLSYHCDPADRKAYYSIVHSKRPHRPPNCKLRKLVSK